MKSLFLRLLANLEEILCGVFLVTMITLVITNVFLRYLFNYSLSWTEEVATICFVWSSREVEFCHVEVVTIQWLFVLHTQ